MKQLKPNLAIVEMRLSAAGQSAPEQRAPFSEDGERHELDSELEDSDPGRDNPALLSEFSELVRRRVAAQSRIYSDQPQPGQVRLVTQIRQPDGVVRMELSTPIAVVLAQPMPDAPVWYGWVASPDVEYAAYWDMVTTHEVDPIEPLASVIQTWNPLYIYLGTTDQVVGQLAPERFQALQELAADCAFGPDPEGVAPQPGRLIYRNVGGQKIITGTPYGQDGDDSRLEYQLLYHDAAEALRDVAALAINWSSYTATAPDWKEIVAAGARAAATALKSGLQPAVASALAVQTRLLGWLEGIAQPFQVPVESAAMAGGTGANAPVWQRIRILDPLGLPDRPREILEIQIFPPAEGDGSGPRCRISFLAPAGGPESINLRVRRGADEDTMREIIHVTLGTAPRYETFTVYVDQVTVAVLNSPGWNQPIELHL